MSSASETIARIAERNKQTALQAASQRQHSEETRSNAETQEIIFSALRELAAAMAGDKTKSEAISAILTALDDLEGTTGGLKTDIETVRAGLNELEQQVKEIPAGDLKQLPKFLQQRKSVEVTNLKSLEELLTTVNEKLDKLELHVEAPQVNVEPTPVTVSPADVTVTPADLSPVKDMGKDITKAIKAYKLPDVVKTEQTNSLISEHFDEYRLVYDTFDDGEQVEAIKYYLKGKLVATLRYTYNEDGNIVSAKRVSR